MQQAGTDRAVPFGQSARCRASPVCHPPRFVTEVIQLVREHNHLCVGSRKAPGDAAGGGPGGAAETIRQILGLEAAIVTEVRRRTAFAARPFSKPCEGIRASDPVGARLK